MNTEETIEKTVDIIKKARANFAPKVGIILGSGMGNFAREIQRPTIIHYSELPGMRECCVAGHPGSLYLGTLGETSVACFQGRNHFYEGHAPAIIQTPIRVLKKLGVNTLLLTGAVGSLSQRMEPGSLTIIHDHINLQFLNPLVGPNDENIGPRFPGLEDAYDPELRRQITNAAIKLGIPVQEGVYIGVLGPSLETPAEIRAFRQMGADVVGMSLVPEVITARHCGMKVLAICIVSNMAAGMSKEKINHEIFLSVVEKATHNLTRLLVSFCQHL